MYRCWRPRNFTRPVFMNPSYLRSVRCCSICAMVSSSTPTTISTEVPPKPRLGMPSRLGDQDRQQRDTGQEEAARQRDARQHAVDVVRRARPRLHAGDEPALLLQVLRQVHRVEDDRGVEVAEQQDHARAKVRSYGRSPGWKKLAMSVSTGFLVKLAMVPGHDDDRLGEDDRHHAGGDQPDRDERLLPFADPPAAHDLARDLDGDPARGDRHGHDGRDDGHEDGQEQQHARRRSPRRS